MNRTQILEKLKEFSILSGVSGEGLKGLASLLEPRRQSPGSVIVEENSPGNSLFFLAEGQVRIEKNLPPGGAVELATLHAGDLFGEMALLETQPRSAQVTALTPVTLLELDAARFQSWLRTGPQTAADFLLQMVRTLSERLRETSRQLSLLFELSRIVANPPCELETFLQTILDRSRLHLGLTWNAHVHLWNPFSEEWELKASTQKAGAGAVGSRWKDLNLIKTWELPGEGFWEIAGHASFFFSKLLWEKQSKGGILWELDHPIEDSERDRMTRTLTLIARLASFGMEAFLHRQEELFKQRLKSEPYPPV